MRAIIHSRYSINQNDGNERRDMSRDDVTMSSHCTRDLQTGDVGGQSYRQEERCVSITLSLSLSLSLAAGSFVRACNLGQESN